MNRLLFTINLLIISSLAVKKLVFNTPAILDDLVNPSKNIIDDKFIVFFDNDCLAQQTRDVIQDFLDLFLCYTLNEGVIDLYPDTVHHWIYMGKNVENPGCDLILEDRKKINYIDYCLEVVEPDQSFELFGTNQCESRTVSKELWNLDSVSPQISNGIQYIEYDPTYNPNIDIIIMDSGVDFNHEQFTGIATLRLFDAYPTQSTFGDHGTHVCGTVLGTDYGAFRAENTLIKLIDVRVFPTSGSTTSTTILNGYDSIINYLAQNQGKKAIINMSFGGGNSNQFDIRLTRIRSEGGISFAAAGNSNTDAAYSSPASSQDTITVGALNRNPQNTRASFSNYDPKPFCLGIFCNNNDDNDIQVVDIWAPGVEIKSAINGPNADETGLKSGTSMATPLVAGIAANILVNNPGFDFDDISITLINNALKDVDDGRGRTGLPRVQATCSQYGISRDINLDYPQMVDNEYYKYNRGVNINYKGGKPSMEISKYMVQGFVITLFIILICFVMLYCNQKSYNEMNEEYNSYKVVEI